MIFFNLINFQLDLNKKMLEGKNWISIDPKILMREKMIQKSLDDRVQRMLETLEIQMNVKKVAIETLHCEVYEKFISQVNMHCFQFFASRIQCSSLNMPIMFQSILKNLENVNKMVQREITKREGRRFMILKQLEETSLPSANCDRCSQNILAQKVEIEKSKILNNHFYDPYRLYSQEMDGNDEECFSIQNKLKLLGPTDEFNIEKQLKSVQYRIGQRSNQIISMLTDLKHFEQKSKDITLKPIENKQIIFKNTNICILQMILNLKQTIMKILHKIKYNQKPSYLHDYGVQVEIDTKQIKEQEQKQLKSTIIKVYNKEQKQIERKQRKQINELKEKNKQLEEAKGKLNYELDFSCLKFETFQKMLAEKQKECEILKYKFNNKVKVNTYSNCDTPTFEEVSYDTSGGKKFDRLRSNKKNNDEKIFIDDKVSTKRKRKSPISSNHTSSQFENENVKKLQFSQSSSSKSSQKSKFDTKVQRKIFKALTINEMSSNSAQQRFESLKRLSRRIYRMNTIGRKTLAVQQQLQITKQKLQTSRSSEESNYQNKKNKGEKQNSTKNNKNEDKSSKQKERKLKLIENGTIFRWKVKQTNHRNPLPQQRIDRFSEPLSKNYNKAAYKTLQKENKLIKTVNQDQVSKKETLSKKTNYRIGKVKTEFNDQGLNEYSKNLDQQIAFNEKMRLLKIFNQSDAINLYLTVENCLQHELYGKKCLKNINFQPHKVKFINKILAAIAGIHNANQLAYEAIKGFLIFPYQSIFSEQNYILISKSFKSSGKIRSSLNKIFTLHKQCNKQDVCEHLKTFLMQLQSLRKLDTDKHNF